MVVLRATAALFCHMVVTAALGISVSPIRAGDHTKLSSKLQLDNCVAYDTTRNDVITVHVQAYDKVAGQQLNLHIFDSDDNQLRLVRDISGEVNVVFTNLHSDVALSKRGNIIDKLSHLRHADSDHAEDVLHSNEGKSRIHVCFDNIYADKSWSFVPQPREIEMLFTARDFAGLKKTNFKLFTKYFLSLATSAADDVSAIRDLDFEDLLVSLELQLQAVIAGLDSSEHTLQALISQETKLRNANEEIFSTYTKVSIAFLILIAVFGLVPIVYMRFYLKTINMI